MRGVHGAAGPVLAVAALSAALCSGSARAADEEIQVYQDEMSGAGKFGLDLHTNYVLSGDPTPDHPGGEVSLHRFRMTPEWSYGVSDNIDLGLYLPLTTLDRDGQFRVGGVKGRIKYIAPKAAGQHWFWGANFEIGRVRKSLDLNPWNAELKGVYGWRSGRWTVGLNANVDWVVSGPAPSPAEASVAAKVSYQTSPDLAVGFESYNSLGTFRRFGRLSENEQALYGVVDKNLGKWDLNVGLGHTYGTAGDGWVLKLIIGVPIDG